MRLLRPREAVGVPPWKHSRLGWRGLWATWFVGGVPFYGRSAGSRWSLRPLPNQAILWSCGWIRWKFFREKKKKVLTLLFYLNHLSWFHGFSLVLHIITSCSALGVEWYTSTDCQYTLWVLVSWSQKRRLNYNSQKIPFFHFHFPFGGKDKMDWEQQDGHFFLLGHFAYSIRVRTLVLETLSHILLYLLVSISIILYCIVLSHIPLIYLVS